MLPKKPIRSYFMVDYSFYSKEHGGTFHFLQFNIMRTNEVSITAGFPKTT